jgi:type I restriction enzyme R subunit
MSNFVFLKAGWPDLFEAAAKAESLACSDARSSCFYTRRALELAVHWLYKHEAALKLPYQDHLSALIHEPTFRQATGPAVFAKARVIKDLGNLAVHSHKPVRQLDALTAARELFHVLFWLARTYSRGAKPANGLVFDPDRIPKLFPGSPQTLEQLRLLESQLCERDEKLAELLTGKAALDEELKRLRAEVAEAKKANSVQPDTHDYSEAETRDYFIDLLLREAGWALDQPQDREFEVAGMPNGRAEGSWITCSGATTASRSRWSKPSAPDATPGSASSRRSFMQTAWKPGSARGQSSFIPTAMSTGCGTMRPIRLARFRDFTRRPNLSS